MWYLDINSVKTDFLYFLAPFTYILFWNSPQSSLKNRRKCIWCALSAALPQKRLRWPPLSTHTNFPFKFKSLWESYPDHGRLVKETTMSWTKLWERITGVYLGQTSATLQLNLFRNEKKSANDRRKCPGCGIAA